MRLETQVMLLIAGEVLLILAGFAAWLVGVVHCIRHKHDSDRLMWVLIVCFLGPVGTVLYFTMGKPKLLSLNPMNESAVDDTASAQPPFDHLAMQDEKKRARAINEALSGSATWKRRP